MTTPNDIIRAMFDHHLWATSVLIDHLEGLPEERLDASVPGTYGSMIATLTHLIDADARYLLRLTDPNPPPAGDDREGIPLTQLRGEVGEHRRQWNDKLDALERGELRGAIRNHPEYPDTEDAEGLMLIQAIHHGNDHRTQVCSTLGALGLEVPDLDGWTYWAQGRR